jgi:hypothetical protein
MADVSIGAASKLTKKLFPAGPLAPCPAPEATCSCCGPPATVDRARSHELASTSFSPLQQHHQRGLQAPYGVSAELAKPRRPETVQSGEPGGEASAENILAMHGRQPICCVHTALQLQPSFGG